jgi:cytochrome bd ubiquinol oxidase subunit I
MDAVLLSRIQFAFTIGFHIIFPTLTMGLAVFLAVLEGLWLATGRAVYAQAFDFWLKPFGLAFGVGVVTGVVLSYEIGTNFGPFARITGNVLGPMMSYEVLMAFFLEAGFLGIMLLGRHRVGRRVHFLATLMVAIGTQLSAFWILAANSFMHTPAGYRIEDGILHIASWWEAIFNPSFPFRLAHMLNASLLAAGFFMAGIAAFYLRRGLHEDFARATLRLIVPVLALAAPLQLALGDLHGLNTLAHQPMKIAAMEAYWEDQKGAPLHLFAWPDQSQARNRFEISIPQAGSLILKHERDAEVAGLERVPPQDRPHVALVFFSFRVMVGIGLWMIALALAALWQMRRGFSSRVLLRSPWEYSPQQGTDAHPPLTEGGRTTKQYSPLVLRLLVWSTPLGVVAVIAGWIVTETGRQPWAVQGLLRTAASVSPIQASMVANSLGLFILAYFGLFLAFLAAIRAVVRRGPIQDEARLAHAMGGPSAGEQA